MSSKASSTRANNKRKRVRTESTHSALNTDTSTTNMTDEPVPIPKVLAPAQSAESSGSASDTDTSSSSESESSDSSASSHAEKPIPKIVQSSLEGQKPPKMEPVITKRDTVPAESSGNESDSDMSTSSSDSSPDERAKPAKAATQKKSDLVVEQKSQSKQAAADSSEPAQPPKRQRGKKNKKQADNNNNSNNNNSNKDAKPTLPPPRTIVPPGTFKVFVGGLPYSITKEQLIQFFKPRAGNVWDVRIATFPGTNEGRGFAHLEFENEDCVGRAIDLNGIEMDSDEGVKKLTIRLAESKPDAPSLPAPLKKHTANDQSGNGGKNNQHKKSHYNQQHKPKPQDDRVFHGKTAFAGQKKRFD